VIDATCPLVEKVHYEARQFASKDFTIMLVGEEGHDETVGTMGWAPAHIKLVMTPADDVETLEVVDPTKMAYITQTTLSVEDCEQVIQALRAKFPAIQRDRRKADICYATSNRQAAVRAIAPKADLVLVVGDRESANSTRLAEIAAEYGKPSYLISNSGDDSGGVARRRRDTVLLTSGASVPESLVQEVISYLEAQHGPCEVEEDELVRENVHFRLARRLRVARIHPLPPVPTLRHLLCFEPVNHLG
jgi:4-hydroxy-3-methylbut-2-en-1-yl diphosphate reductase